MQDGVERAEGELRLSNQRLVEINKTKSEFLAEVAHEFKTPLTVIIGYADMLRTDVDRIEAEQRSFAESIEKSARQLTTLIDDLTDITQIDSGHFSNSK